jgi:hypothetical protein
VLGPSSAAAADGLDGRIVRTLDIAARWGYGLSVDQLARLLYGGPVAEGEVARAMRQASGVAREDGFATVAGREDLLAKSIARHRTNGVLAESYMGIACAFTHDLLRHSPFVRAVAISGSTASEGLGHGDDVDLNLFAEDGTKYIVYITALLLGIKYSLRLRRQFAKGSPFFGLLPKVTCVNVVWTQGECRPFVRQDEFLAFELLRSRAIAGGDHYRQILEANPWLAEHFPQALETAGGPTVTVPPLSGLARLQRWFARGPTRRRWLDRACRHAARALHRIVDLSRQRNPEAVRRAQFLRRVKFPYDVLQDGP